MKKSEKYLVKNGYEISYIGFEYLTYILDKYKNIRTEKITDIYREVAKKYNATYAGVERNIRYLLSKKDQKCNKKIIAKLIGGYRS
jgi:hypothetical protein